MHVVASKPAAPGRNPARDSYAGLGGRTVRLEAPDELPGSWDGPVYATLIGDPQLRAEDDGPFFDDADGRKRPAWQVTLTFLLPGQRLEDIEPALREHVEVPYWIPHWRLTQTSRNLAHELQERPLLSVFRFLRFTEFFVATPRQDTKFTRHTSDVFLCGQVLDYRPATSMALVDDIDLIQEPGCSYICMVRIRGYQVERHQVVAIPLVDVRSQVISRDEFMLGFSHGLPATLQPPPVCSCLAVVLQLVRRSRVRARAARPSLSCPWGRPPCRSRLGIQGCLLRDPSGHQAGGHSGGPCCCPSGGALGAAGLERESACPVGRIWSDDENDSWSGTFRNDEQAKANDDEGSEHPGRADANEIGNDGAQANGSDCPNVANETGSAGREKQLPDAWAHGHDATEAANGRTRPRRGE
jgi:hypothetical protein